MADRIITVTDPSVVTNDTLAGYNNYSDIDGQLGTTMTPTEATNGKTVTLSDGVTHQVTSKPVGTTNGEFSAVVSNSVTVNLAPASWTDVVYDDLDTTYPPSVTGTTWSADATGAGTLDCSACLTTAFTGDFHYRFLWNDIGTYNGIALDATADGDLAFGSTDYIVYASSAILKESNNTVTKDPGFGGNPVQGADRYMSFRRVGTTLTLEYYNGSSWDVGHTFTGVSGTLYLYMYATDTGGSKTIIDPAYQ